MIDIVGKKYWYFAISALLIIPGIISLAVWGLNLGIDFTGGTLLEYQFKREVSKDEVALTLMSAGVEGPSVQPSPQDDLHDHPTNATWPRSIECPPNARLGHGVSRNRPLKNSFTAESRLKHPRPGPAGGVATAGEAPAATVSTAWYGMMVYWQSPNRASTNPLSSGSTAPSSF